MKTMILAAACGLALAACGEGAVDTGADEASAAADLKGGCRQVCPHCPPNRMCPAIACYLDCNNCSGTNVRCMAGYHWDVQACTCVSDACVQQALCIQGYAWDSKACACVPSKTTAPGGCTTDADCHLSANYCGGCACDALNATDTQTSCSDPVQCFADPCMGKTAVCVNGTCAAQ